MAEGRGPSGNGDTPEGPVAAARRWISAVMEERDWEEAWQLSDPLLRLALAQAWLWPLRDDPDIAGHDLDELAEELASSGPECALWPEFAEMALATYVETWREFDPARWSLAVPPQLVAPDLELVVFAHEPDEPLAVVTEPRLVVARPFLLRFHGHGWLVVHPGGDRLPVPGWPPEFPAPSSA